MGDADPPTEPPAPSRDLATSAPVIGDTRPITASSIRPGDGRRACDIALDGTVAGRHHVAAASLVGLAHTVTGTSRQDAYGFCLDQRGRLYVAVADGLGSRPVSQLGARILCDEIMRIACEYDDDSPAAPAALIATAGRHTAQLTRDVYGLNPRDAGCVAIVGSFGPDRYEFARVGDPTAFTLAEASFVELFDHHSDFVNLVDATIPEDAERATTVTMTSATSVIALVTDGLATDIRNSERVRAWLMNQWATPTTAYAMGESLRYRRQGSHDDRTAVVIWTPRGNSGTDM